MLEGMGDIQRNMAQLFAEMEREAAAAADEVSLYMASYAKSIAPWTDRTGNLRNSIAGSSSRTPTGLLMVVSESMNYAPFVEEGTSRSRPYPSLWPTVAHTVNSGTAMGIFARHLQL